MADRVCWCGSALEDDREHCPSCELYNAAVAAQRAAAQSIAEARFPGAKDAFLNVHGVMAWVGGVCMEVGSASEAAPFAKLTGAVRRTEESP